MLPNYWKRCVYDEFLQVAGDVRIKLKQVELFRWLQKGEDYETIGYRIVCNAVDGVGVGV